MEVCAGVEGYRSSLLWRSLRTDQFPSPALSLFNISIQQMWTGHEDDCNNGSPIEAQITPHFAAKLHLHAHSCTNRTAHVELLAQMYQQETVRSLLHNAAENTTQGREAMFQTLLNMSWTDSGDYVPLQEVSNKMMGSADYFSQIAGYMQECDPSLWPKQDNTAAAVTVTGTEAAASVAGMDYAPLVLGRFANNFSAIPVPVLLPSTTSYTAARVLTQWLLGRIYMRGPPLNTPSTTLV